MMKKHISKPKKRGLKTLLAYIIIVLLVIAVSLIIRATTIVKESKFDGEHRFTLVLEDKKCVYGIISLEPKTSSLSKLTFSRNKCLQFSEYKRILGIIPDGYIKRNSRFNMRDQAVVVLKSILFNPAGVSKNISSYDVLRFYLYARNVPYTSVDSEEIPVNIEASYLDQVVFDLFSDSAITDENVTIQVINATGQAGLGSRLERVITNLGGNVVSVKTATISEQSSRIQYYGENTYTLQRLQKLIPYPVEILTEEPIARIVITIGKDKKDKNYF